MKEEEWNKVERGGVGLHDRVREVGIDHGAADFGECVSGVIALAAGYHHIKVDFFEDDGGGPVKGRIQGFRRASAIIVEGTEVPEMFDVTTLCLDAHHWFFVHGIRVHNKVKLS